MGIKFDILRDRYLLNEDSDFSRFFSSPEPIKFIHDKFKISHDTKLVLSPTNNRHSLWDKLREGKGLFAVINKPELLKNSSNNLKSLLKTLTPPPNRTRTFNEIKDGVKSIFETIAIDMGQYESVTSAVYNDIKNKINKPNGLISKARSTFETDDRLIIALKDFESALLPGEYILIRRTPVKSELLKGYDPVVEYSDTQRYIAYFFDKEKLVNQIVIEKNAVQAYRQLFPGWGDRSFYIIEETQFGPIAKHPFRMQKDFSFEKLLPLTNADIQRFVEYTFSKYEAVIDKKITNMTQRLKQQAFKDIELIDKPDHVVIDSINEYRKALKILKTGVNEYSKPEIMLDFLKINTSNPKFKFISSADTFIPFDPYRPANQSVSKQDWETKTFDDGLKIVRSMLSFNRFRNENREYILARLKSNRNENVQRKIDELNKDYEIWDRIKRRWIPYDPNYIEQFHLAAPYYSEQPAALIFNTEADFNDFTRKFMLFALRNMIKEPEIKDLENLIQEI